MAVRRLLLQVVHFTSYRLIRRTLGCSRVFFYSYILSRSSHYVCVWFLIVVIVLASVFLPHTLPSLW